ncbi:flagellar basal-body rod protein FlgG [bacterium]|nr:flagellar basal-body rod protein FlgG [bacterium]
MIRALRTAASGMHAQQMNLDTISNNLANVNTTSFKKSRVEFQDLIYQTTQASGSVRRLGTVVPTELQIGHGVKPVAIEKVHVQGSPTATYNDLDMAIEGDGFFQVRKADDTIAYTRDGSFKRSPDGRIVTSEGYTVYPELILPEDAMRVSISRDGVLSVQLVGATELVDIGRLELARFTNKEGLRSIGQNMYIESEASGPPIVGQAGMEGFGEIHQGYLEASNVNVVEEMVNMITAQRAYEINSKAIKTADEMMQQANQLKR